MPLKILSHYTPLLEFMRHNQSLFVWYQLLEQQIISGLNEKRFGDLIQWQQALETLPSVKPQTINLVESVTIGQANEISSAQKDNIEACLKQLIPWRKGPFFIFGIRLDSEWRSDWKWQRLLPHIKPLHQRLVLDVGCGNGYHCLRVLGAGANRVVGIDPSPRFIMQFLMLKHFLGPIPVDLVPTTVEALPADLKCFDTTFSMGVLYHRRSPIDHLRELKATLKPGGQLVLETLIIEGDLGQVLVPQTRYSKMPNVWFIPSAPTLLSWMKRCGFKHPRLVDKNQTSVEEQRTTDWMQFQSLQDFLDPGDPNKTLEGYPAPLRGIFIAEV